MLPVLNINQAFAMSSLYLRSNIHINKELIINIANEITVKVFHVSPISKFRCSQGNGAVEGKVPNSQETLGVYLKLCFQKKQPSLFARSFSIHLTAYVSEN